MILDLKIYKLTYAGKAIKLSEQNLINHFTLFDILVIYHHKQRRVYIWIGKKASQNLKSHIPRIRDILLEHEPNLVILRNITIESGFETTELLELLEISQENLHQQIKTLETRILPLLSEINKLKENVDNAFNAEDYEQAIQYAIKIKEIAKQVNDTSLEQDQENLIEVAKSKYSENELISQLESDAKANIDEFNQLVKIEYYQEAHKIVKQFKRKYETNFNLSLIPVAQQLLLKDENIRYSLKFKEEGIKKKLDELETQFNSALKERNLFKAENSVFLAKKEIIKIIDDNIISKWNTHEATLLVLQETKLQEIFKLANIAIEYLDKGEIGNALKHYRIIANELKNFQQIIYREDKGNGT